MNYDLAMMALDGLARSPITVRHENGAMIVEGEAAGFKELARLFLLLGGAQSAAETFELQPGVHSTNGSPLTKLVLLPPR
ncbi:MAG TPA: hypothetical protein VGF69_12840 [Thermoanaerobaculia bacterium]|jgi:hypothetical protein